jgi:glutamate-1-semialdehyde aminotransferase
MRLMFARVRRNLPARVMRRLRPPHRVLSALAARGIGPLRAAYRSLSRPVGRWLAAWAGEIEQVVDVSACAGLVVDFETIPATPTCSDRLFEESQAIYSWPFIPTWGVSWSSHGPRYPLLAREAKGCHLTDLEGRRYVDYLMGHGCNLLGYAPERISQAVAEALRSAAIASLSQPLEMEVVRLLREVVPSAESVLFGKHGSDACTAAVRLARAHTGRAKVLFCGYHGWQDWYAERKDLAQTGIPKRPDTLLYRFRFNDLTSFEALLRSHAGDVAAVIIEPSGPVQEGRLDSRVQDVDPEFLRGVADAARRAGALVIFDEVMTGFRYPGGTVQKATGVVPDLTCLGKGLSAGLPLSALVGRKDVFASRGQIAYGPTFSKEVYSLVAAREALAIYREHDVPSHITDHGERLRQGINGLCERHGAPAEVIGPPFRMLLAFQEPDEMRRAMMRTLVQQELLQRGVLTLYGFMVPSFAHDDDALGEAIDAFDHALRTLVEASATDTFVRRLEIPPVYVL